MKKLFKRFLDFYHTGDVALYVSLFPPLVMGTLHLVLILLKFDWILFNYCLFFYLMCLARVWQWAIKKYQMKMSHYLAGIISVCFILFPMMAAFVLTIRYKDAPHYLIDWFIYAYATYGTIKIVFAIKNIAKKDKDDQRYVLSYVGLIGALYTIQMMEFNLIMTFDTGVTNSMYLMQLFTQGAIFLFSLFVIGLFIHKAITLNKNKDCGGVA